jgi:rhodanese-related sulfurtransferase
MSIPYKDVARGVVIILGLAMVTALTVNFVSPRGIALVGEWDTARGVITAKPKDDVVSHELEIGDIAVVKMLYDSGQAVFVDVRAAAMYEAGHIQGATSLPLNRIDERMDEFKALYPRDALIVTYCSGRECDDSHEAAQCLIGEGYTTVRVFLDGFPGWQEHGYPIEPETETSTP